MENQQQLWELRSIVANCKRDVTATSYAISRARLICSDPEPVGPHRIVRNALQLKLKNYERALAEANAKLADAFAAAQGVG